MPLLSSVEHLVENLLGLGQIRNGGVDHSGVHRWAPLCRVLTPGTLTAAERDLWCVTPTTGLSPFFGSVTVMSGCWPPRPRPNPRTYPRTLLWRHPKIPPQGTPADGLQTASALPSKRRRRRRVLPPSAPASSRAASPPPPPRAKSPSYRPSPLISSRTVPGLFSSYSTRTISPTSGTRYGGTWGNSASNLIPPGLGPLWAEYHDELPRLRLFAAL